MTYDIEHIRDAFNESPCTHAVAIIDAGETMLGAPWMVIAWEIRHFEESAYIGKVTSDQELSEVLAVPLMNFSPALVDVRLFGDEESRKEVARQAIEFAMSALCGTGRSHDA